MEKAERTLREFIRERGAIESQEAASIIRQISHGLREAGDWVHRDLKPENILLLNDRWQIADFGIARQSDASTSSHTLRAYLSPPYAAPEQWNGVHAEHSTDVYALGCIGFELVAGSQPFAGPSREDYADQHRNRSPALTAGVLLLQSLVLDMLAKQMRGRPLPQQVLQRLDALLNARQGAASAGAQSLQRISAEISEEQARAEADAKRAAANEADRQATAE
jgi:eukaryotic-like serine/threonine-protein kinase